MLDLLFAQPVLAVRQVGAALGVNAATAWRYVNRLEDVGLLQEITGHARKRVFRADEVLRAIEEPLPDDREPEPKPHAVLLKNPSSFRT